MKMSFVTAFLLLAFCQSLFALTGREIVEKSDALPEPDTGKTSIVMFIHKGGRVTEKEFQGIAKKFPNDEERMLISFIRPTRIKLLTHSHKSRDDDQWLRLSSGKVKRIAVSDKDKPFVNSHFYYEDLQSRDIDDYSYQYLGDGSAAGFDCYKVESIKKKGSMVYDKTILYVRKSDYFIVRIDLFRKGKLHKYLENYEIKKVKGILTPFRSVMYAADGKGKTELRIQRVVYNKTIRSSRFNKESLR